MTISHPLFHTSTRTTAARIRTPGTFHTWLMFALQLLAIESFELGDDIFRGNIHPPDAQAAVQHAHQVIHVERALDLFVEPSLQLWTQHVHGPFGLVSPGTITAATDAIYALGQTLVPLLLAIWIFRRHRSQFPLVRSVALLTVLLAVVGYEIYPLAPPRLTTGLIYQGHSFHFLNTASQVIGGARLNGVPIGYNAYSAMPSLHIGMALIVAGCLLLLSSNLLVRALASLYPIVMLFTVVVSGNHFVLDAAGGAMVVALATVLALALEPGHAHLARLAPNIDLMSFTVMTYAAAHLVPAEQEEIPMNLSSLDSTDLSPIRQRLLDLRADVLQRREYLILAGRDVELDPDGIAPSSSERDPILANMLEQELAEIDDALARLASGTYGRCARCDGEVSPRRLEALPAAGLCVACQSNAESTHVRGNTHAA